MSADIDLVLATVFLERYKLDFFGEDKVAYSPYFGSLKMNICVT